MKKTLPPKARFFRAAGAFHAWLDDNHASESELVVGFYKKDSGKPSITYPEALDEALAYGWIDGIRRGVDAESYTIRFTPRKVRSIWSNVNIKRAGELQAAGRMMAAGLAAFEKRDEKRSGIYSYERSVAALDAAALEAFEADEKASAYWDAQAPSYRRMVAHWLVSAKKPETRARRLATLIDCSRRGKPIPPYAYPKKTY
jgi:uncharacterized protein YdeI (YjbR/CyaY-like superfamily)